MKAIKTTILRVIIGVDIFKWARMIILTVVSSAVILFFTISILTLKIVDIN